MAGEKRKGEEVVVTRLGSKSAKAQLDQRGGWCLSYVRALNTQFAAWVEQQKREHPNELWQEGVEDYLKHATKLLTEYRDVVDWLKSGGQARSVPVSARRTAADGPVVSASPEAPLSSADLTNTHNTTFGSSGATTAATYSMIPAPSNAGTRSGSDPSRGAASPTGIAAMARGGSVAAFRSPFPVPGGAVMPLHSEADKKDGGADAGRASFSPSTEAVAGPVPASPPGGGFGFAAVRSPMPLPNFATRAASIDTERKDVQGSGEQEDDKEEPPSPSFKSTEEKGVKTVHQCRAKLYFQESGEGSAKTWKDLGSGQVLLKCRDTAPKGSRDAKPTIVFRNEVGKILLNALLYTGMKVNPVKRDLTLVLTVASPAAANGQTTAEARRQACLLRLPKEDDAKALADALRSHCPV